MILLVNQLAIPVFQDIANTFVSGGYSVTLFSGKVEESHSPLRKEVDVVHSIAYRRNSLLSRLTSWLMFSVHIGVYLLFKRNVSHILVVTNPPTAPFVVRWIAGLKGIPFTLLVYDLYPDALLKVGIASERNWIYTRWQEANSHLFNSAKTVVTLSESMKAALLRYLHSADRVAIIPNWVETSYIKPMEKSANPFVLAHGLSDKLVVLYSGNMGFTHDLESLIEAAVSLKLYKDIKFVLIGDGAQLKKLKARQDSEKLDNLLFLPYQSAGEFPSAMAAGDIGVVTLGLGAEGISVPSKTYVNMAAGLCLLCIAPRNSELNRIVDQYACGHSVEPQSPNEIVEFIMKMRKEPEMLTAYKKQARLAALNFGIENAERYLSLVGRP